MWCLNVFYFHILVRSAQQVTAAPPLLHLLTQRHVWIKSLDLIHVQQGSRGHKESYDRRISVASSELTTQLTGRLYFRYLFIDLFMNINKIQNPEWPFARIYNFKLFYCCFYCCCWCCSLLCGFTSLVLFFVFQNMYFIFICYVETDMIMMLMLININ